MGLLTPSEPFQRPHAVSEEAHRIADRTEDDPFPPDADAHEWLRLAELSRDAVSPLTRVEHLLLPWSSFVVLPLFALANMGVELSASSLAAAAGSVVAWAILVARIGGKILGIWGGTLAASRLRLVDLPVGVRSPHLLGMAVAAGTGFTVSLFIAEVTFGTGSPLLSDVKIALLTASVLSGVLGWTVLRLVAPAASHPRDASPPELTVGSLSWHVSYTARRPAVQRNVPPHRSGREPTRHPTRHGGPCARHPRSGERPARRRLHLDGDHLPLGDLRHLADGARLRLLPRPRGPRRLRGHREDEGDRSRDPGRRERLSVASVPNGRHLPRDPHGHPVLRAARPGERGALGVVDQARPLARVHPGRGVQRHDRLCRDVARGPGERPDGERRP